MNLDSAIRTGCQVNADYRRVSSLTARTARDTHLTDNPALITAPFAVKNTLDSHNALIVGWLAVVAGLSMEHGYAYSPRNAFSQLLGPMIFDRDIAQLIDQLTDFMVFHGHLPSRSPLDYRN
ncbi:hypothetical protein ACR91N_22995 [Klebsiella pneumoniae]|uniref:hypothetical protein n=1 Tax=Klebsiella pneumoniae TaxID=573 RepID=UPI0015D639A0|nr:hypothetical protein [Klebsiella pneumoniae]MBP4132087.1 hypothetical protein [Klebsiella pneumoniae]MCQ6412219.1 hypothetical protein [Klebsiella pneumoniae]MCQ6417091.1 hypothetical protein [Klebsiella pneumoniae]MDC8544651.1 hypothetical protein [Klebsiella pneumoniae]MDI7147188.1 hypothetical protein [Klebsiella pneumoniae]